jgi:hypothetical protein
MLAQLVLLEKRVELGATHRETTRNATQYSASQTNVWWTMLAQLAHQERLLLLARLHLG